MYLYPSSLLDVIKSAADYCTKLTHLNIQFQKSIEKASKKTFPDGVKSLLKLLITDPSKSAAASTNNNNNSTGNSNDNTTNNSNKNATSLSSSVSSATENIENMSINTNTTNTTNNTNIPTSNFNNNTNNPTSNLNSTSTSTKKKKDKLDLQICVPSNAVVYVENVCENMQMLSSLAMKLPSCGFRYGLATAINPK